MAGRPLDDPERRRSRYDSMSWDELVNELKKEPREIKYTQKGKTYAALDLSYWDEEMKQGRHRRKLIGYYDNEGRLVLSGSTEDQRPKVVGRRKTAETKQIGVGLLFDTISTETGLRDCLAKAYPADWEMILSCAYYMLSEGKALTGCERWSRDAAHPYGSQIGDQRISELLTRLDPDSQKDFFTEWFKKVGLEDNYAFDITSISSYNKTVTAVRAGYNRDHENLEQINLGMMIGSKTYMPVYYTKLPGNINDRASLEELLRILNKMKFKGYKIVMDKGFCTKENINEMYRMKVHFTISLTLGLNFTKDAIKDAKAELNNPDNLRRIMGSTVYRTTSLRTWSVDGKNHRCYTHVYYDKAKKEDDDRHFDERLMEVREKLLSGAELKKKDSEFAERYFVKKVWGEKVEWSSNMDAITEYREKEMGYLVIVSNHIKDPDEALKIYRCKETAEQSFDDLKNTEDLRRLRVHTEGRMDGKLFIAFVSLIIEMRLRFIQKDDAELRKRSLRELIDEMKLLRSVTVGNWKSPVYTPRTKLQKLLIRKFAIPVDFEENVEDEGEEIDSSAVGSA